MVKKCPAKYKNLGYIQSFTEQGYATIQLMQQSCMNDEWLRQRVLKLNYLSPPAVRKWYQNGEWVNDELSYGYAINQKGDIVFNSSIEKRIYIDFVDDEDLIDMNKTDAIIMSKVTNETEKELVKNDELEDIDYTSDGKIMEFNDDGEIIGVSVDEDDIVPETSHWCQLPYENEAKKKTYTTKKVIKGQKAQYDSKTTTMTDPANSAWYVGFNKSKNYYVRPDWIKNWKDNDIPSVARGQTFKATATGKLESIDLKIDYTGTHFSDAGSPLYVQIWKTVQQNVVKTVWNVEKYEMEKVYKKVADNTGDYKLENGVYKQVAKGTGEYSLVYEKIAVPDTKNTGIGKPLAQAVFNPSKMKPFENVNIKFDKECKLTKGQSYFIALFSPLSEWSHCPRWAGWGRNCMRDKKYEYGNAFLSENNGRTWIRYGRNDTSVAYKYGKFVPQDFAFTCHIRTKDKIDTRTNTIITLVDDQIDDAGPNNPRYLYLKPIFCNPITSVQINAYDDGSADEYSTRGIGIEYEYSFDGRSWLKAKLGVTYAVDDTPQVLLVRAKLYRDITSMSGNHQKYYKSTPKIYSMNVNITTQLPKSMYVRTHEWQPRTEAMLGASIWGRVYAPFKVEPTVTCSAEIVTNEKPTDHFTIIELDNVYDYLVKYDFDATVLEEIENKDLTTICMYLYNNSGIIDTLKTHNVYIKPFVVEDYIYRMSFTPADEDMKISKDEEYMNYGGLKFDNDVAYPILECLYTPEGSTSDVEGLSERIDFDFDYETNELIFNEYVLQQMTLGDIAVTYNKCFLRGLSDSEVGVHIDSETGLQEEGLILDYFKETFKIKDSNVETRRVKLRVAPVDPIREVVLNRDTENEKELFEGFDYNLDIDTNELEFIVSNEDNKSSVLSTDDILEVVYTPNLQANALSLGYWVHRTNRDKQVAIQNSYWEYKA